MWKLKYPSGISKPEHKTKYLYRLQEIMRIQYNQMGKKFRNKEISRQEWDNFNKEWNTKMDVLIGEILQAREQFKKDSSISIDIDTVFEKE